MASRPGRDDEFKRSIAKTLEYTRVLGNRRLHVMAGLIAPGEDRVRHRETYLRNLAYAAGQAASLGHHGSNRTHQHARYSGEADVSRR